MNKCIASPNRIMIKSTKKIEIFRREIQAFILMLRRISPYYNFKYPGLDNYLEKHVLQLFCFEKYEILHDFLKYLTHHPGKKKLHF